MTSYSSVISRWLFVDIPVLSKPKPGYVYIEGTVGSMLAGTQAPGSQRHPITLYICIRTIAPYMGPIVKSDDQDITRDRTVK